MIFLFYKVKSFTSSTFSTTEAAAVAANDQFFFFCYSTYLYSVCTTFAYERTASFKQIKTKNETNNMLTLGQKDNKRFQCNHVSFCIARTKEREQQRAMADIHMSKYDAHQIFLCIQWRRRKKYKRKYNLLEVPWHTHTHTRKMRKIHFSIILF